jgi:outer membrane receptor for ferrienterochelin and colicin
MAHFRQFASALVVLGAVSLSATIFGSVRGLIHDPQHRPIQDAKVLLRAQGSDWSQSITSNGLGEFQINTVPAGRYLVSVTVPGFAPEVRRVDVSSGTVVDVHFALQLASVAENVTVSAAPAEVRPESSTTLSVVHRDQIATAPGANRTNNLGMITNFVPGAVMVHDQLHIRGGHQVTWLLDGVPVPNTNIASNVGPQFDPKDIDEIEVQRGGYSAEYGDRTYGVFNVVTRTGFERNNEGEKLLNYGSFHSTDDQLNFGSHTQRFAYYASLNGNRTDLGLQTPTTGVLHDAANGLGGFVSLVYNRTPSDQLRLVSSVRRDRYQVPNTLEQQLSGTRDTEAEQDAFANFSWVHTASDHTVLTVSPFYHYNRAHYLGGANDFPISPEDNRGSNYAGGAVSLALISGRHNGRLGIQGFAQHDRELFGIADRENGTSLRQESGLWGNLESAFLEDQFKVTRWFTLNGGVRLTHFSGALNENAADPRIGATVRLPGVGWILRGFYGRYYQAPPLLTVSGPLLEMAVEQGFGFLPLRGERDEQHEFGLTLPVRGWIIDVDHFHTAARNFFDHDALGNSNIFFPLTLERARIRGWETTLRSPRIAGMAEVHLAYSHQFVEGRGGVSGGLTEFEPPEDGGFFFLDHDQRDTLSTGFQINLPWHAWTSGNLLYGSGFLDGDGPSHLPGHTTFDFSLGKSFGESWSIQATALNLGNLRYLVDSANTFGGTHYNYPREFSVGVRYRFKY